MIDFFRGKIFGRKSARRYTKDYGKPTKEGIEPDEETLPLKDYIFSDPDYAANIRRFVDNVMLERPYIDRRDSSQLADATIQRYNDQLRDVRFYKVLRAAIYNLLWHGNAFLEVRFRGQKLKEMYNIAPDTIRIHLDDTGREVLYYTQEVNGSPVARFSPEEIVHISIDQLESQVWGNAYTLSLKEVLLRKQVAEYYLQWLLQKNKIQPLINVKGEIDEEAWAHIVSQFHAKADNADLLQIINSFPDDEIEVLKIYDTSDFNAIQNYINEQKQQIMTLLQVPPIVSGQVDNSNRSNSEIQARLVFYNTIKSFQNMLIEELNSELLKKLNWNNVTFRFPSVDQRTDVETVKLAKSLREDLGWTQEAITEFLKENGFYIPNVDTLYDEALREQDMQQNDGEGDPDRESRQPRDKGGLPEREEDRQSDKQMGVSNDSRQ